MADTEELAAGYTRVNDTQQSTGDFLIQRLGVGPGMRVLDVGCGPGDITLRLAELVGESGSVVGVDPSKERIAIARRKMTTTTTTRPRANLSFHEGRAEDLSTIIPLAGSMDIVFVNSTFHWVRDQAAALAEFARVLKPKGAGRLGMSGGSGDFIAAHERIKADVLSREPYRIYPDETGPKFLKRRELEHLLEVAGFSRIDIVVNTIVKWAKDGESMIEWLDTSSSGKTYGGIPLELRSKAKDEMKREWAKLTTEDGIHMEMELLVTVATKG